MKKRILSMFITAMMMITAISVFTITARALYIDADKATELEPGEVIQGQVAKKAEVFYKIHIKDSGTLTIEHTGKDDTRVYFYNAAGDNITNTGTYRRYSFIRQGKSSFKVRQGTYFISVLGENTGGIGSYTLSTNFVKTTLKLNQAKVTLGVGEKYKLKATTNSDSNVVFTSSNRGIASVNIGAIGNVVAKKPGKVTITADVEGVKMNCVVTVKKAPKKITARNITVEEGDVKQITYKLPKDTASRKVTFKSSNTKIAKVNSKGEVTGKKAGTCTVTVKTFNGKKANVKVTVK